MPNAAQAIVVPHAYMTSANLLNSLAREGPRNRDGRQQEADETGVNRSFGRFETEISG
jgi:hypothetical protein